MHKVGMDVAKASEGGGGDNSASCLNVSLMNRPYVAKAAVGIMLARACGATSVIGLVGGCRQGRR